jgi:hypothetical protein
MFLKHGMHGTGSYKSWKNMKARCIYNHKVPNKHYANIEVCPEWYYFINFYNDMGDRPEGMTLDRIDNNKGYSKDNCRWATTLQQNQNRKPFIGKNQYTK